MSRFLQKISALLLFSSVAFFNCHAILNCKGAQSVPHMGCHEHGRATPTQTPNTRTCCALGHSAALPARESPRIGSPDTSLLVLLDQPSPLGFHVPVAVATERSETPPAVTPLRI
jgi:hypothetical protein